VLLGASVGAQVWRERTAPDTAASAATELLLVRSGTVLEKAALSFDALLADVYWIRALQYFGGMKRTAGGARRYALLHPLLDIATTLDPHFNIAYRFGAIFLTEAYPNGPGRPDLAVRLLEKGIAANPKKWQYVMDIGFVHYWWLHDYQAAARWFKRASGMEGAPWYLESLAANTLVLGGDRQASRYMWQQIYQSADNDWLKQDARRRLVQLDALDQIDDLEEGLRRFTAATGVRPASWTELVQRGVLRGEPVDPAGAPYLLIDGSKVTVASSSPLYPLPNEPPRAYKEPS
jgi:hypothetical protein